MGLCNVLLTFQIGKPVIENVQNALSIEGADISITLAARWVTLTHTHTLGGMVGIMIVVHSSHGHQMHCLNSELSIVKLLVPGFLDLL